MLHRLILIFSAGILVLLLSHSLAIYQFSQRDETQNANCAIVAGAGIRGTQPSPVFQARLDHAIWLYQQGFVKALVLTGGYSDGASVSDAAVAKNYVQGKGVPGNAVYIEEHSKITRENIRYAKVILEQQHWQTALLVSDPLHMLRLKTIAQDLGIKSWSSPTTTSRYQSRKAQLHFLLRESFYYSGYRILRLMPVQNNSENQ
ncbi:YdcF family protein [Escherichia albertii]|uniref:YdcF family protein n=1 Tax=Escherichia albertii TaxID=208962 RepID=UPI0007208617|nr:YdcF family protein [Escherichia albertii]EGM8071883.1 YdcF family protein [Escherichia albertii]EHW5311083.1 YdcF family protein [Escherichia albertii]EJZ2265424.1 YdcF family protein [Escherichia albertii]MCU7267832.1 YdcF family protein [Escherichia albertii]MCU7286211.1 YdcF family protein [Escherichia albertii]